MKIIKFRYIFHHKKHGFKTIIFTLEDLEIKDMTYIKSDYIISGWKFIANNEYTGLEDNSNPPKEIYEGDIVRILYIDWESKSSDDPRTIKQYMIDIASVGKIVYKAPKFEIGFGIGKYGNKDFGEMYTGEQGYIKVIGNIYENPKLLKKT